MSKSIKYLINKINNNFIKNKNLYNQIDILKEFDIQKECADIINYNIILYARTHNLFFNKENYNKLLLNESEYLKYYLITWNSQSLTKLHTHSKECLYKICSGELKQTLLTKDNNYEKEISNYKNNDVVFLNKNDYHQIHNLTDDLSISFHIYNKI